MLTKARLVLLTLLLVGGFAATPQKANATGANVTFDFEVVGSGAVAMTPSSDAACEGIESATCSFTAIAGAWVTLTATPSAGQTFVGWGGHAEGWCDLSLTCRYRVPASGRSVVAEFAPARVVTVSDDTRVTFEFIDSDKELVGTTQETTCDWHRECVFLASRTGQLSMQVAYGEAAFYPYTVGYSGDSDDAVPTNGFWSHGPGVDDLLVNVQSYRRTLTLNPSSGVTMALLTETDWSTTVVEGSECVGPASCVHYVYEGSYIVGITDNDNSTVANFDISDCDGTFGQILEFDVGCLISEGLDSQVVAGKTLTRRTVACSMSPPNARIALILTDEGVCTDDTGIYPTEIELNSDRSISFYAFQTLWSEESPQMFYGWRGDCAQTNWNEICVIPPGESSVSVIADFGAPRLLKNRTFVFRDFNSGATLSGGTFTWFGSNGTSSSAPAKIPMNGQYKFGSIMGGGVYFHLFDVGVGSSWRMTGYARATMHAGPRAPELYLESDSPGIRNIPIKVVMESGRPVPGALVSIDTADPCTLVPPYGDDIEWTLLPNVCVPSARTNERGNATLVVPYYSYSNESVDGLQAVVTYGDMSVTAAGFTRGSDGVWSVVLEDLPYIDLESVAAEYRYGAAVSLSAVVRDREGNPLPGAAVVLSGISRKDSACAVSLAKVANSAGRVTFTVCPTSSKVLTLSSAVGVQTALKVNVRTRPSSVRSVVPVAGIRSVTLRWKVPAEVNAGAVTDYVVQYRLVGQATWRTYVDGKSSRTAVTVKGLLSRRQYEFRIAAKNKAGAGVWSAVIVSRTR
jgi:hypothetical protein